MGVARMHGEKQSFVRGATKHQDAADALLVAAGWEWYRRTGHEGNAYRKTGCNTPIIVSSTPKNPTQDLKRLKRMIHNLGGDQVPTETKQTPTAPLIAMADAFLLHIPDAKDVRAVRARNAALAGWVKRVLTKHGPLPQAALMGAMEEMGFKHSARFNARREVGAVGFRLDGENYVGLDYQVPEGDGPQIGQPRKETPTSGVQVTDEHPVGANNGAGPEPREEPAEGLLGNEELKAAMTEALSAPLSPPEPEALVSAPPSEAAQRVADKRDRIQEAMEQAAAIDLGLMGKLEPPPQSLVDDPSSEEFRKLVDPDPTAIPFQRHDGDVVAAAQLLVQSLGIKTAHPRMGEGLDSLDEYLSDLIWRLEQAREKVSVLKGLLS